MKHFIVFLILITLASTLVAIQRNIVIQDFEVPDSLVSIPDYDLQPDSVLISPNGYNGNCLYLFGDTGKKSLIRPFQLERGTILKVSVYAENNPSLIAIGISDSLHNLRYSLYGNQEVDFEEFVPVYQGAKEDDQWIDFLLPVSDDWIAWYDYLPMVSGIDYILSGNGEVRFDEIYDITEDLNQPPECSFSYRLMNTRLKRDGTRDMTYQFTASASDPEGQLVYMYNWNFGDGTILSNDFDRTNHTFTVLDDHSYSVMLTVSDSLGARGSFVSQVDVDQGDSSLPIKLNFVGDVMMARRMTMLDIPNIFSDVDSVFGQVADFSIANLETPLADTGTMHPTKSVAYRSEPTTVNALNNAGIDIVSLANNHTMDYMEPALLQTQDVLADHNILYCGAGMNSVEAYEPVLVSEKGMVLAFMGCSDRTGQYNNAQPYLQAGYNKAGFAYMTPYYLTEQINNVDEIADLKIVMMHGGSEYSTQPGSDYDKFIDLDEDEDFNPRIDIPHLWDIEIRHFAIDAGADLVIVHHPHKVQAIEVYNGKVIAHSLGNFVFDLNYPECFPSMILNGDAYADGFRYFTVTPVYLDHYKPKVVTGELGTHLLRDIAMKSRDLNTIINVRPDINRAEVILDTLSFNMEQELVQVFTVIDSVETGEFLSPPLAFNGIPSSINQLNAPDSTQFKLGRELFPFGNMEDEGIDYWDLNAQCSYDSLEFASGSRSLRIDWQNTEIDLERNLPLVGDDLSLVGKIKTRACTEAEIEINYYQTYNSTYSSTEETSQSLTGTNDWTDICLDLNPPAWAGYFRITLRMDGQTDSTAVWFDDLHLITWDTWQSEVPMQITYPNDYYWLRLKSVEASDDVQCIYGTTNITFYDPVSNQDASSLNGIHHVGNYPNPFNPTTTIEFSLSNPSSELNVSVYNIRGQKVKTIFKDRAEIGKHSIIWDGTDKHNRSCATGVYFYKISTSGESYSGKMLMLK